MSDSQKPILPSHTVTILFMGGADVISCESLGVSNLELSGELTPEAVKEALLRKLHIPETDSQANFTVKIDDKRPPADENYNEQKARESKEFKRKKGPFD